MSTKLAELVRSAAQKARAAAEDFPDAVTGRDLPWKVVEAFDADVRGHVERDRRIEDERDRLLIAAVKLAEALPGEESEGRDGPRRHLARAIDYLEEAVLRFGLVNRKAARLGYGDEGAPVSTER